VWLVPFKGRRLLLVLLAIALLAVFGLRTLDPRQNTETRFQILAMGTVVEVVLYDVTPPTAQAAEQQLGQFFAEFGRDWWAWGDGALARLNRELAEHGRASLTEPMRQALLDAQAISAASGGLFNPAVGRLVKLWGFHQAPRDPALPLPTAAEVAALLPVPDMASLQVANQQIVAPLGTWLDLGGYAKGIAIDGAIDILRGLGVQNAIVSGGGDLRAIGQAGERRWRIGIRNPRGTGSIANLDIAEDECVFTSGDYERMWLVDGQRYHHIIDPRTGYPARGLISVTVVGKRAARADASATALLVAGPSDWPKVAAALGATQVLVVDETGKLQATKEMAARLHVVDGRSIEQIR